MDHCIPVHMQLVSPFIVGLNESTTHHVVSSLGMLIRNVGDRIVIVEEGQFLAVLINFAGKVLVCSR